MSLSSNTVPIGPTWKNKLFRVSLAARWELWLPRPVAFNRARWSWDLALSLRDAECFDIPLKCIVSTKDARFLIINTISGLPSVGTICVSYRPGRSDVAIPVVENPSSPRIPAVRSA